MGAGVGLGVGEAVAVGVGDGVGVGEGVAVGDGAGDGVGVGVGCVGPLTKSSAAAIAATIKATAMIMSVRCATPATPGPSPAATGLQGCLP